MVFQNSSQLAPPGRFRLPQGEIREGAYAEPVFGVDGMAASAAIMASRRRWNRRSRWLRLLSEFLPSSRALNLPESHRQP
jgi:hypothetical protein